MEKFSCCHFNCPFQVEFIDSIPTNPTKWAKQFRNSTTNFTANHNSNACIEHFRIVRLHITLGYVPWWISIFIILMPILISNFRPSLTSSMLMISISKSHTIWSNHRIYRSLTQCWVLKNRLREKCKKLTAMANCKLKRNSCMQLCTVRSIWITFN